MPQVDSYVSENNYKTKASNNLGTRAIQRWVIYTVYDITNAWEESNSVYSQLVRAISQNVELYAVYRPGQSFFNSDNFNYSFTIDAAVNTSVDLWTALNSQFGTDLAPEDWEFAANDDFNDYNNNTKIIIDAVYEALNNAGVNNGCWVNAMYTMGDQTWPIGMGMGDAPPGSARNVGTNLDKADPTLVPQPGDSMEVLQQKKLKFLAKLRGN